MTTIFLKAGRAVGISAAAFLALALAITTMAAPPEHYLHVRVNDLHSHEYVRVNVPLSLAEKVIPAIDHGNFHGGMIECGNFRANGVDLRAILDAVKNAPDGEFVSIEEPDNDVRVAKSHGTLIVHVIDKNDHQKVDVTVPWAVAQALTSSQDKQQLNVEAALEALDKLGDTTLVTVTDGKQNVRVWVDSHNTAD